MADFKKIFSVGVAAAETAAANKKEIEGVISEVNKQLQELYDEKVHFGVWDLTKRTPRPGVKNIFVDAFNYDIVSYKGLCISNKEKKEPIVLAEWQITENGYPCILKYDDREAYCYNTDDLETELATLLSDVKTGKAILKHLNTPSEKE